MWRFLLRPSPEGAASSRLSVRYVELWEQEPVGLRSEHKAAWGVSQPTRRPDAPLGRMVTPSSSVGRDAWETDSTSPVNHRALGTDVGELGTQTTHNKEH